MHLMIDLETLSTAPTAVVTQLGWAVFDPDGDDVASSGCVYLDAQAQIDRGLTVDWSTIQWWLMQEQAAREKMASDNVVLPSVALDRFDQVFDVGIDGVWSHGATFDVVIMENLYRTAKRKVPWKYRDVRDTRTIFWLAGSSLVWAKNEVKHSAEHDAIAQALTVQRAVKMIKDNAVVESIKDETGGE